MSSYEQTLHLFGRWLSDELQIYTVDKITENVIRKYIDDLMVRGKYTFYVNDLSKKKNCPDRRRDYRKPVSVTTINNYIRNIIKFLSSRAEWNEVEGSRHLPPAQQPFGVKTPPRPSLGRDDSIFKPRQLGVHPPYCANCKQTRLS